MSSTPNHFFQGYIASKLLGWPETASIALGLFMAFNDLIAFPGHIRAMVSAKKQGDSNWIKARDWSAYIWWHHSKGVWFIPVSNFHALIDHSTHDKDTGKWTVFGYFLEGILWAVILFYFIMRFFLWQNRLG